MENKIRKIVILLLVFFALTPLTFSQSIKKDTDWKPFYFILGEWIGEGSGTPGQGRGSFSFDFDLQKKILIRKSSTYFPSTKDRSSYSHDDLTIIYKQPDGSVHGNYFDNEGHIINYSINFSDDHNTLTFVSDISPINPRYRLTYSKINNQKLNIKFEIASSSNPVAFSIYYSGTVHRK
ncbi:MAG: hypothetical protein M1480_02740 [Bacteroidetes bacterium]|nr:hypothetical protein [Bacteroidota bacterium]